MHIYFNFIGTENEFTVIRNCATAGVSTIHKFKLFHISLFYIIYVNATIRYLTLRYSISDEIIMQKLALARRYKGERSIFEKKAVLWRSYEPRQWMNECKRLDTVY